MKLPGELAELLTAHRQQSSWSREEHFIFCRGNGRPLDPDRLRREVPALEKADIERQPREHGFQAFRHAARSILYEMTKDIELVKRFCAKAASAQRAIFMSTRRLLWQQLRCAPQLRLDATTPERLNSWNRPRLTLARSLTTLTSRVISLVLCGPSICSRTESQKRSRSRRRIPDNYRSEIVVAFQRTTDSRFRFAVDCLRFMFVTGVASEFIHD
jgi:hypothetical protein